MNHFRNLAILFLICRVGASTPAQIVIFRHAEEPPTGNHLSKRGYERAEALVNYFKTRPEMKEKGRPVALFAAATSPNHPSLRSIETITPLSKFLKIRVISDYRRKDISELVEEIFSNRKYGDKMVVICWPHSRIPEIAREMGFKRVPKQWPDESYNRTWVLDFDSSEEPVRFRNLPQNLLAGDVNS